jgi:hypothetical protein
MSEAFCCVPSTSPGGAGILGEKDGTGATPERVGGRVGGFGKRGGAEAGGAGPGGDHWLHPFLAAGSLTPPSAHVAGAQAAAAGSAQTAARPEQGGRCRDAAKPTALAAWALPGFGARQPAGLADAGICRRCILSRCLLPLWFLGAALHQGWDPE